MNDDEALLALAAGDESDQSAALAWLCDTYFERLLVALEDKFRFDAQFTLSGAGRAFQELRRDAARLADEFQGRPEAVWGWLLRRAADRTRNEQRDHFRSLTGPHGAGPVEFEELDTESPDDGPEAVVLRDDERQHLMSVLTDIVPTLDPVDKHIFLHDLVVRHEVLTPEEADHFDDAYLSRSAPDQLYTRDKLKKRRQRLTEKLRKVPALRAIR